MRFMNCRYLLVLGLVLSACRPDENSQVKAINENLQVNGNIALIKNTIPTSDRLAGVPMNPAYLLIMADGLKNDGKLRSLAYPVNCEEEEANKVLKAFGLDQSSAVKTSFNVATLNGNYSAQSQPVLNCSAVRSVAENQQISAVFRMQPRSTDSIPLSNPSYYVKFNGFANKLFQVGCLDILTTLAQGVNEQKDFAGQAIPLMDAHVLHYLAQDVPETALNEAVKGDVGISRLFCRSGTQALPQPKELATQAYQAGDDAKARLLYVEAPDSSYYVYAWSTGARKVECPGASASDMLAAFHLGDNAPVISTNPNDSTVLAANSSEPLRCVSPLFPPPFEVAFRTVKEQPERHAYKASRESSDLFTFGCSSAETFFVEGSVTAEQMIPVAPQSLDYLLSHSDLTSPGSKVNRVHIPCAGNPKLYADVARIYHDVLNLEASSDKVKILSDAISRVTAQPSVEDITQHIIKAEFHDGTDLPRIIASAFQAAQSRRPTAEESGVLTDWIKNNQKNNGISLRRHYLELFKFLQRVHGLGSEELVQCYKRAIGRDPQVNERTMWFTAFLTNPDAYYTSKFVEDTLVGWNQGDLDNLLSRVVTDRYQWVMNDSDRAQLNSLVKDRKLVRAHYLELMNYLNSVGIIPYDRYITLKSAHSKKVLEVKGAGGQQTDVQQWDDNGGNHQRWILVNQGDGTVWIKPKHVDACLTLWNTDTSNNADVKIGYCDSAVRKRWKIVQRRGGLTLQTAVTGGGDKCLDLVHSSTANGARLASWACNNADNQLWFVN